MVPFLDLKAQYQSIKPEIDEAIHKLLRDAEFIGGEQVQRFEAGFAAAVGAEFALGVGNGTDALFIILHSLGIGAGSGVITAANSFIASSETITAAGATPVFVDCDPVTYCLDLAKVERTLDDDRRNGSFIKAIIPVHLYGRAVEMTRLNELAKKFQVVVIEDCAQAHLARHDGKTVGSFGIASAFSFYPGKNLGAYGDAGAITTNDAALAKRMRMFANHGRLAKYDHEFEGINSRLDALQAAVLNVKLPKLADWTKRRQQHAALYDQLLQAVPSVVRPDLGAPGAHVFHLYVVQVANREHVAETMKKLGVATGIHYPKALPNLTAYRHLKQDPSEWSTATKLQDRILSLPMFPELTEAQIKEVVSCLAQATM